MIKKNSLRRLIFCTQTNPQLILLVFSYYQAHSPILFLHQWNCFTLHDFGPGVHWASHLKKTARYRGFDFQSIFKRIRAQNRRASSSILVTWFWDRLWRTYTYLQPSGPICSTADLETRVLDRAGEQTGRNRSIKTLQATIFLAMVTTIPNSNATQWSRSFPSCLKVCWQASTHGSRPKSRTADRTFTNTISIITQRVKAHGWNQRVSRSRL